MSTPKIRFVYFDLGNLLVTFDRDRASRNVAGLFASDPTDADIAIADERMRINEMHNALETGTITEAQFSQTLREAYRFEIEQVSDAAIMRAISDMFTPIESMTDVLARVRATDTPIGILSNTCDAHWSWVDSQAYGVMAGPFDVVVLSYQAGSMKPDRVIYAVAEKRAAEYAGVNPNEILFVDDREENVSAASRFGWNAEVCLGGEAVEKVLVDYGVLTERLLLSATEKVTP